MNHQTFHFWLYSLLLLLVLIPVSHANTARYAQADYSNPLINDASTLQSDVYGTNSSSATFFNGHVVPTDKFQESVNNFKATDTLYLQSSSFGHPFERVDITFPEITLTNPVSNNDEDIYLPDLTAIVGYVQDLTPDGTLPKGVKNIFIKVERYDETLQVTKYLQEHATINDAVEDITTTTETWIELDIAADGQWVLNTEAFSWTNLSLYTITVKSEDNYGNLAELIETFYINTAGSDVSKITLTAVPDVLGEDNGRQTNVQILLSNVNNSSDDLTGEKVWLDIKMPDASDYLTSLGPYSVNAQGQYTIENVGSAESGVTFDQKGAWSLRARYDGSPLLKKSITLDVPLLVDTSAGYAVIVEGKSATIGEDPSHNKTTNRIYQTLLKRSIKPENIYYFNYDDNQEGVDYLPNKSQIQSVIVNDIKDKLNINPAPLHLIFVDHGTSQHKFQMGSEEISAADIDGWLDALDNGLDTEAKAEVKSVILGFCYSGGFVEPLAATNRIVISSAAANEESYKGPLEDDGIRSGEYFLEEFFQDLGRGETFHSAFMNATDKTEIYTRTGGAFSNTNSNSFLDGAEQHPLLEDDGLAPFGTNELEVSGDGIQIAKSLKLGEGPKTNSADNPASIKEVTSILYLGNSQSEVGLWLKPVDNGQVSRAYVEIRKSFDRLSSVLASGDQNNVVQQTTGLIPVGMIAPGQQGNPFTDRHYVYYTGFTEIGDDSGIYEVFYYVEDKETGQISPSKRSIVYKNLSENNAPTTPLLVSPLNSENVKKVVRLDWESSTDPDQHAISYELQVAMDETFTSFTEELTGTQSAPYQQHGIVSSSTVLDATVDLAEGLVYYWRVRAVDAYGEASLWSEIRTFKPVEKNVTQGIIKGIIFSDRDFVGLSSASVTGIVGSANPVAIYSESNGEYVMILPEGTASLAVNKDGFISQTKTDIQITPSTADNPFIQLNFNLLKNDIDNDGVLNDSDTCPDGEVGWDSNQTTDYDGDGCKDSLEDLDDDNDLMPDAWEEQNGLNSLDATDAAQDKDGDGLTNLQEYNLSTNPGVADSDGDGYTDKEEFDAGTNPNDINDVPIRSKAWRAIIPLILNQ